MNHAVLRSAPVILALTAFACGGAKEEPKPPIQKESAADEVLRIGDIWESVVEDKGILSPPSKISLFKTTRRSRITLTQKGATEELVIEEVADLVSGSEIHCKTSFTLELKARWGRRAGEAGIELVRPPLNASRHCDAPHPEPMLVEGSRRALFVLRSDKLVVVEPALEDRAYLPVAY